MLPESAAAARASRSERERHRGRDGARLFSLFQLEPDFALDETALERAYHTLLTQFHPDRYAGKPQVEHAWRRSFALTSIAATAFFPMKSPVPNTCCSKQELIWSLRNAPAWNRLFYDANQLARAAGRAGVVRRRGRQSLTAEIEGHYATSRDQFASTLSTGAHLDAARHWQEMCYLSKLLSEPKFRVS